MIAKLLEPLALRPSIVARNRVWLAPLTNMQSHADGTLSEAELGFLAARADGGFGLVETCAAHVSQEGKAWPGELGVHDDAMLDGLTRLAKRIHDGGALASAQLFHGGLRADPKVSGLPTWSASAHTEEGNTTPREATEADVQGAIDAFAAAAVRCARAGFDAIELHGAHGYLLSQFQSVVYNQRTDRWGGSFDNRVRLIRETVRAVKASAPSLVLGVRLSPEDYGQAKGIDLDETIALAKMLREDGMEVLHLSLWRSGQNTKKRPDAHPTTLFREALGPSMTIVAAGGIWTREDAELQLSYGADAVALGRAAIANARWPELTRDGGEIVRAPVTPAHLLSQGLAPGFVEYMRKWKGYVAD